MARRVDEQLLLELGSSNSRELVIDRREGPRAIEDEAFPFEDISEIAELESWRKEIARPIYHIHKWWAQRLGSVFRAIVIGTFAPEGANIVSLFYSPSRIPNATVFDPFMGSGTTVGEVLKLGGQAIGRDINPVSHFIVHTSLGLPSREDLIREFASIEADVADEIRRFYKAKLTSGEAVDTLYYFWVKQVACPTCASLVDLFPSYVFAQNAYPARRPDSRILCPACGAVNVGRFDATSLECSDCEFLFDPQQGNAHGARAVCPKCSERFVIVDAARELPEPPPHRAFAKMVFDGRGDRLYLPFEEDDLRIYRAAELALEERRNAYPIVAIEHGHNTKQVLNYSYRQWHQMFNARQLLCLSILAERVGTIGDDRVRAAFTCLFSGVLEFNNMFASFKGEGTGAVRHMFSHHILKPERVPLEANPWGTPKSSGSFSTLFERRLMRALDYREDPFELNRQFAGKDEKKKKKVFGLSVPLRPSFARKFNELSEARPVFLSQGDSSCAPLPDRSVDAVITDPPFFDNVHYSELADFFYVWQRFILGETGSRELRTTRSSAEVQHTDAVAFGERLSQVWCECSRVLKDDGLFVFTYHHSRPEGWSCLLASLMKAGFRVVQTHPIKSEMSVAQPKHQAKEPVDLDIVIVCRKRRGVRDGVAVGDLVRSAETIAERKLKRLTERGRRVSRNDVRIVVSAQLLAELSTLEKVDEAVGAFESVEKELEGAIERVRHAVTA